MYVNGRDFYPEHMNDKIMNILQVTKLVYIIEELIPEEDEEGIVI